MNTNAHHLGHHLTEAHIEQISERAAKAYLDSAALYNRRNTLHARRERMMKYMAANGITESKRKNIMGCDAPKAVRIKKALYRIRLGIGNVDSAVHWNKMDRKPCVLTDFTDRNSATVLNFGY